MDDLKTAERARQGAAWVREHGFVKGARWDGAEGHCALGIIERVCGLIELEGCGKAERFPESRELLEALAVNLPDGPLFGANWAIASWNNDPNRTADELIDLFESTALALEIRALAASPEKNPAPREELVPVA